ncbi:MAG: hypothetical protein ISR72_09075 [Methylobacter sp.]|nr:hypothetical protein [Methylobacter sp.]
MEYLLVKFRENRSVIIDDHEQGKTNEVIELVGGQHSVTLGGKVDYLPTEQTVVINTTSVVSPHEIQFT